MENKKYPYDSVVIFKEPIILPSPGSPENVKVKVFGMMYNKEQEKHVEAYPEIIDEYVVYLHVVSNFLEHGNTIEKGCWCLKDSPYCYKENKTLLRVLGSVTDIGYTVTEYDEPVEIREGETEGYWILSQALIERVNKDV